jgi:succinyl-CoA synthetase beta subunit
MRMYEFEAKEIFKRNAIPVPVGMVIERADQMAHLAGSEKEYAIKSQLLVGGRGKAGGIKFARTAQEARSTAQGLFEARIKGLPVKHVLVEEKQDIERELYLGITVDTSEGMIMVMASSRGGMDIEEIAKLHPEAIIALRVDIRYGLPTYAAREMMRRIGLRGRTQQQATGVLLSLYGVLRRYDALVAEINPLAITKAGDIIALDAKLEIDDDALFRQPEIRTDDEFLNELEIEARKSDLKYVQLDGDIGVIGNGAGLNMTTIDILRFFDGNPANFLEVSGRTYRLADKGIEVVLKNPKVKVIFGNFFGCISRCDVIAQGLAKAVKNGTLNKPMVVSMRGNGAEEGRKTLREVGIPVYENDRIAGQEACRLARGR